MDREQLASTLKGSEIAVVGMAGRFPGARNVDTFWANLRDGVESLTVFTDEQLRAEGVDEATLRHPQYVRAAMVLDDMEMFDAGFFGFSPRDAAIMDPQHRHFIEVAWEALEHAGYDPKRFNGAIGVFGGTGMNAYMPYNLFTNPELMQSLGLFLVRHTGNDKDFLTTRVSYLFDLRGPSINVQTACSTSLVAIHLACQSLINFECDMALAGGATIELPHRRGYMYQDGEILSPDGHCRAFDHRSEGTVFGSGAGVVALRRLDDALRDGDTIHAVIRGSAVNNDGSGKMNYFAPSVDGQSAAIAEAIAVADIPADTISYVEAHGTGTALGDPIEIAALTKAFRITTSRTGFCGIGSVKTNIGHLDTAAGVASFIKVVQALRHGQLPPSLNYEQPNPMIDFASSPFYVNDRLADWRPAGYPRRAGVSSLGVGGTNAHVVLEEAPVLASSSQSRPWQLLMLSARTPTALDNAARNLADYLEAYPHISLADAAWTLQVGRQEFAQRRIVTVRDHADAITALRSGEAKRVFSGRAGDDGARVAFMFPGGGAQYPNMGRGLYESEAVYRETVDHLLAQARRDLQLDLKPVLYPDDGGIEAAAAELEKPLAGLVALFITEYATARLWMSWGIQPAALTGHSMGEYTAACLAGVMTPEEALSVVALRGRLFESLPKGAMVSIPLPEHEVLPLLVEGASVSVINSPSTCVVSGSEAAIEAMEQRLTENGISFQRVRISVAAHSPMLDPILDTFRQHMARLKLKPPTIPYISNLSGTWINPADAASPQYWVDHLRHTVRFADGIATLMQDGDYVLLEVGPGNTLGSLARDHAARPEGQIILSSLRHPREAVDDVPFALTTLGRLWAAGQSIDWVAFHAGEMRCRVPLPTYPFDHQRYWIEPGKGMLTAEAGQERIAKLANMEDWFYKPVWKRAPLAGTDTGEPLRWLVFLDALGLGRALVKALEKAGHTVYTVHEEQMYTKTGERSYGISPRMREDYFDLVEDLTRSGGLPHKIVHLWAVTGEKPAGYSRVEFYEKNRDNLFYSLLFLTQALTADSLPHHIDIGMVSNGMQDVLGEGLRHPEKAILLGPCRVIPHEYASLSCRSVDVVIDQQSRLSRLLSRDDSHSEALAQQLVAEFSGQADQTVVAYRDGERWVQTYEPARLSPAQNRLREGGVYLITGGLGGIGLTQAEHLARTVRAKLILIGRSGLPARDEWDHWLKTNPAGNRTSQQIRRILDMEAAGAEVMVARADVSNRRQLQEAVSAALAHFGTINGVIHAAGTIDDNLIQLKTAGAVERVLAPKVRGALLLDELLQGIALDFFILFSSTSTILGPVGQADYAAANAFLDAFAHHKRMYGTHTVAVNWGMWQEVGMAVNAAQQDQRRMGELAAARDGGHPLLEYRLSDSGDEITYAAHYSTDKHWILDQHRLKDGTALLPGTGYLEIARAAVANGCAEHAVEISNLTFISPLEVADGEQREVRVSLHRNGSGYGFALTSRSGSDGEWLEHAQGRVRVTDRPAPPARCPLDEIAARCSRQRITYAPGEQFTQQEEHLLFGPRWKVLREAHFGQGEALALLELPPDFTDDLTAYLLHPALLDLATGFGLPLTEGYDQSPQLYVPFAYGRVRVLHPLPERIYSHARYKGQQNATTTFDVTLLDEGGCVLVEIEDFTMKRVGSPQGLQTRRSRRTDSGAAGRSRLLDVGITEGIRPEEGVQVLDRVLTSDSAPQVVATSLSLDALAGVIAQSIDVQPEGKKFTRPAVGTAYVEPRDELEAALARIWENALGIAPVGVYDDFFELGGQSLIAIRLLSQFRRELNADLPMTTFFEAPTIAQCADRIRAETAEAQPATTKAQRKQRARQLSSLVAIQPNGTKPPFFCVHGAGGNVMVFSVLADYLGLDQPLYGLQEQGVDGRSEPLTRIEDMAALYIREIRQVYPHGPYLLGGFSMGGEVAFEMAQQLVAAGEEVRLLVLFDTLNPVRSIRMHSFSTQAAAGHEDGSPGTFTAISRKIMGHVRRLSKLTPREQIDYLSRDARMRFNRIRLRWGVRMAKASGQPLPYRLIEQQLWETNLKAVTNYVPHIYPGRITLFRASENLDTNPVDDPMGWGPLAAGGVDEYIIDGAHRLLDEPYVVDVVRHLRNCLEDARS